MSSRQPPDLQRLLHELEGVSDWRGLGIEFKISYEELNVIEQDWRGKTKECQRELLHRWLCRVADPTWSDVVEALRRMKLVNLAEKIEERFCHDTPEQEHKISAEPKVANTPEDVGVKPEAAHVHTQGAAQPFPPDPSHEVPSIQAPRRSTYLESHAVAKDVPPSAAATIFLTDSPTPSAPPTKRKKMNNYPGQAVVPLSRSAPVRPLPEVTPTRIEEIHNQVEILQDKFLRLVCNVRDSLSKRQSESPGFLSNLQMAIYNIPVSRRQPHIKFLSQKQQEIEKATSVTAIFQILSLHWDYINTVFVEFMVKFFAIDEVKQELADYLKELAPFSTTTKLCEFKSAFPSATIASPPGFLTVTAKVQGDWANYTLQKALQFGWQLSDECCLEGYTLHFVDSGSGCIRLVWAVPPSAIPILAEALTPEFLKRNSVDAIHVDGVALPVVQKQLISSQEEASSVEDISALSEDEQLALALRLSMQELEGDSQPKDISALSEDEDLALALQMKELEVSQSKDLSALSEDEQLALALQLSMEGVEGDSQPKPEGVSGTTEVEQLAQSLQSLLRRQHPHKTQQDLLTASQTGHVGEVLRCLAAGVPIDSRDQVCGATPLIWASFYGHKKVAVLLLEQSANVDAQDERGFTPLIAASGEGHTETAELLLKHSADINMPNKRGLTPLIAASQEGHTETAELLLKHSANVNMPNKEGATALLMASQDGRTETVQLLLEYSADVNQQDQSGATPLFRASKNSHKETAALLLEHSANVDTQNKDGATALTEASQGGHTETAQLLLEHSANVNQQDQRGFTPLITASQEGHTETAELLLKHTADTSIQTKNGVTALFMSTYAGHPAITQLLLELGADPNIPTKNGLTPLMAAVQQPDEEQRERGITEDNLLASARLLLAKQEVDVNVQEPSTGWTALFFCCRDGNLELVKLLLQRHGNTTMKDHEGLTVLEIAHAHGHLEVCRELERYTPNQALVPEAETDPSSASKEGKKPSEKESEVKSEEHVSQQAKLPETVPSTTSDDSKKPSEQEAHVSRQTKTVKESVRRTGNAFTALFKIVGDRVLPSRREKMKGLGDNKALTEQKSPRIIEVTELERND